jgi:hypothetical protein
MCIVSVPLPPLSTSSMVTMRRLGSCALRIASVGELAVPEAVVSFARASPEGVKLSR